MGVQRIAATVFCDGGLHQPINLHFYGRVLKSDIARELRSRGWVVRGEKTFCREHK